ncbi:PilZ domain-containing protein [Sphingomonas sp. BK580]|uniref:PilZ domain-containing protein n=1 Tax=Sphingomonas sp. BK580 TaxID=2586972 RepID=UPI00161F3F13|nr:PilZ domain-containing protein [Sphingomonas sp. BK580]MBB3693261.1 hypothetical protein [Sphingomonas sp. BK580]
MTQGADQVPSREGEEQRAAPRERTLYALGRLIVAGQQHVCTVRNLGPGGAGIELDTPPALGTAVTIETRGLIARAATVRWVREPMVGLTFDEPLGDETLRAVAATPRSPRFGYDGPVELVSGARLTEHRAIDLGLGGVRIAGAPPPDAGSAIEVVIDAELVVRGKLAWTGEGAFAIEFAAPLSVRQLAGAIARLEATLDR